MMLLICRFVTVALTFGYVLYSHFAEIDLTGYMLKKILNQVRNIFFFQVFDCLKALYSGTASTYKNMTLIYELHKQDIFQQVRDIPFYVQTAYINYIIVI